MGKDDDNITKINFEVYDGTEPYLFVSYSHKNTDTVNKILNRLDKENFRLWYDDTMEIGSDFREELKVRIEGCGAVLLFVSNASMLSKYVGMEIMTAFKDDKRIYPIYLEEDVEVPNVLKLLLENLQHLKGYAFDENDKYIDKLIMSLPTDTMRALQISDGTLIKCKDGSKKIVLDENVKIIGDSAFKHCIKLECITFSDTVLHIGNDAFRGCSSLQKLTVPKNIRYIGESAFRDCISLTDLIIENDEIEISERAFENCPLLTNIVLPNNLTEIYNGIFNSCTGLEIIDLPENIAVLGENAFADCTKLKTINIPKNLISIDNRAFSGCLELEEISLSEELIKIGNYIFLGCKSLTSVQIPPKVSSIGLSPFKGCKKLQHITVDPKNKYFKSTDSILFNKNKSTLICFPPNKQSEEYEIPDSITVIEPYAFFECILLKKIIFPDCLTEIGSGAFSKCSSIEKIEIPDGVIKIDDIAFRGCRKLKEVSLPDSICYLGWEVFRGCKDIMVKCNNTIAVEYCKKNNIKYKL